MAAGRTDARRIEVSGLVQGVGFRPFVHRLALRHELGGWVLNAAGEVRIHVEGDPRAIDAFVRALREEAPPLARIERLVEHPAEPAGVREFAIEASAVDGDGRQPVSPDVAMCAACAAELHDPANRRYRYPFITCTDCGPRFTIIESMPYDRERTSMRAFAQCPACAREYATPGDRRYHSETNSCAACGPVVWFERAGSARDGPRAPGAPAGEDALAAAARVLDDGGILALRGLGGFHLAVDATNEAAVARLRARKHREAKPLAVMVRTLEEARAIGEVGEAERALLESAARPIVLLAPRRAMGATALAPSVAPGLAHVGVMLAYTPLHDLLLSAVRRPLVMTSGNLSDEPIAIANDEARRRLGAIADAFLLHDREIVARYDDSVVRVASLRIDGARGMQSHPLALPILLRRARGIAPLPMDLPVATPVPLLAVGPHLKNTFTLAHGSRAYPSQHVGDLESLETIAHFGEARRRLQVLFAIEPTAVAHDLHPDYLSTRLARESGLAPMIAVQHHHAHVAAVLGEHGRRDDIVGLAFDGTGFGDDGRTWGAEVLFAGLTRYERVAQLRYAPLPGGDVAARSPWRVAAGYLSLEPSLERAFALAFRDVDEREREMVRQQLARGVNVPLASSMGRLFDAAAAVLGVRRESRYEGQAAMELEALAGTRAAEPIALPLRERREGEDGAPWQLDPLPMLAELGERARRGADAHVLAAAFHEGVAEAAALVAARACEARGVRTVALGGGVFQNARLLAGTRALLESLGLEVLVPTALSPNDGAVSYGQAVVAAARLAEG